MLKSPDAWLHNVKLDVVRNPNYKGPDKPKNGGLSFIFYSSFDTAYTDLESGNLDVLDTVPVSALGTYKKVLGSRALTKPTAQNLQLGIPYYLPHFTGEEGRLRRTAISMAINRPEIIKAIFRGARGAAQDFTARSLPGWDPNIPGNEVLTFDPVKAKQLWAQANAIAPWSGTFEVAYNSDGGHQAWIDAVANSIKNTLGIDAVGAPYPTFKAVRDEITRKDPAGKHTFNRAFRYGWQGDYPTMLQFLTSNYYSHSDTNDVEFNSPDVDRLFNEALAAPSPEESYKKIAEAQTIMLRDMADIPVFDYIAAGGRSDRVKAQMSWNGLFDFENIEKV